MEAANFQQVPLKKRDTRIAEERSKKIRTEGEKP